MKQEKFIMFSNRLTKSFRHLSKQAKRLNISCWRVYDHDIPEFPFSIEIYKDKLYVAEYKRHHKLSETEHEEWLRQSMEIAGTVIGISPDDIFLRLRQRKESRQDQYRKQSGKEKEKEYVVEENGLKFIVNLSDYLDTGLFLDHRVTREMVRAEALGKKVLNLFCYTGSFSVYAAAGGASEVVSVDLSKTYLNWAERNLQLNGFKDPVKYKMVHADVMLFLEEIPKNYFDLVVLDPPTFSNSRRMEDFLDIQRDHVKLINNCLKGMTTGATLYFSTNSKKFILDKKGIKATSIKDLTRATTPFDFEGKLDRQCFKILK